MSEREKRTAGANGVTRRQAIVGGVVGLGGLAMVSTQLFGAAQGEISRTAEAIHQVVTFKASRARVYEALTDAKQFDKVVKLSAAVQSGMSLGAAPTKISAEAGSAFSLFGGYISGRQVELVQNQRMVQAWRTGSWNQGDYSIARFVMTDAGEGTQLVFDHTGFPNGDAEHLAEGWKVNYWEPMAKVLAE